MCFNVFNFHFYILPFFRKDNIFLLINKDYFYNIIFFRRGTHGGRRCANCRNAHFSRGTVMKASSHEKHTKNHGKTKKQQKKQKVQTHVPCQASPQTLPMGLNFLFFFCFFWFSRGFGQIAKKKTWKNQEKTKKTKSSDPCPLPGLSPDLAHGSELFVFFLFFWFSRGFGQIAKKPWKNQKKQKKTKSSDPCPLPGLSPDLAHGSELFVFFWFSRGFGQIAKKTWKNQKQQKKQKVQTHVPCQASPQTLPMGLNFLFFLVFSRFWPNCKKNHGKTKKTKKNKKFRPMSPARPLPRPFPWV